MTESNLQSCQREEFRSLESGLSASGLCSSVDAQALNDGCWCISMDRAALRRSVQSEVDEPGLFELIEQRCPYVFAARPVFLSNTHVHKISRLIEAVESVAALPAWRAAVLADAPAIARMPQAAPGVFYGYDFHLTDTGIALVEINTNAGGAMLNAVLARAQQACCAPVRDWLPALRAEELEADIVAMFRSEWQRGAGGGALQTIAIVDDQPQEQYLYPEFLLFQRLFRRHGMQAVIADPRELEYRDGRLWSGDLAIDLVYNRLTDFMLEGEACAALRAAYLDRAAIVTPHPLAHAVYADKRNLALLSDPERLREMGVSESLLQVLAESIPRTELVDAGNAERLWAGRRKLFFKPAAGYGGRAAYRGDKLTKRVWQEILAGGYVAQALVPPSERSIGPDGMAQRLKFDVRAYAYEGKVQWLAARLYQGQTTNFRTPGGGFAPVYPLG